jgi:hypothetical protein
MKTFLKTALAASVLALGAPSVASAMDQGTAHVQLSQYAHDVAAGISNDVTAIGSYGVDPNAMWLDNGTWGGHVWVRYLAWPASDGMFTTFWDCLALSPSYVYCEWRGTFR